MHKLKNHFLKTVPSPKKLFLIFFPELCCCNNLAAKLNFSLLWTGWIELELEIDFEESLFYF